jgi:hypothetical protein
LAEVLPEAKVDEVRRLQVDVGIAIGTSADVAIEATDVTLMCSDLRGVARGTTGRATTASAQQRRRAAKPCSTPQCLGRLTHPTCRRILSANSSAAMQLNQSTVSQIIEQEVP